MRRWKRVSVLLTVLLLCFGMTARAECLMTGREQWDKLGTITLASTIPDPEGSAAEDEEVSAELEKLDGKRFGVQTGSTFDRDVLSWFPHAQLFYYNSLPDLAVALNTGKIDAFPTDSISLEMMGEQGTKLRALDRFMDEYSCGFVFDKTPEGEALRDEFDDWMDRSRESGALDEKLEKWIHAPEEEKTMPDYRSLPGEKGVLKFATEAGFPPFDYMREDEVVGYEVEMAIDFCTDRGYGIEIIPMNFDGILPALQSGKIDFAASGFAITQERMESINFSQPYYHGGTKIVVKDNQNTGAMSFLGGIQESFEKTFLREQRWKLFLRGIGSTLLITVSSLLLGTVLGFLVFLLCRRGSALTDRVTRGCLWLVQGMPVVVLLMVLYYLIFANVAIGGTAVSVIGFTILFGASTFGLMKMGVGAVDSGQYEAASALGYTDTRTFFKIILPQALPHVADAYRGEVVGLIKATAVVGYIAVQDLTKMGDLVRSRTYEAFFPLIAVTVIYFLLEGLLDLILKRVARRLDPRARSREDILKGITREE